MKSSIFIQIGSFSLFWQPTLAGYDLTRTYHGSDFLHQFNFRTSAVTYADYGGDPTHGFVNYVSAAQASGSGLFKIVGNQVFLGVDNTTILSTAATGRNSIRLESKETFSGGLLIADIEHMPGNICGVWPAFWTYNFDEDPYGELDIIEGAMNQELNAVSLHTCGACSFDLSGQFGTEPRSNCDLGNEADQCAWSENSNDSGCGSYAPANSYGDDFNKAGGGVYVTQVEDTALSIWYFNKTSVPSDITAGAPDPTSWSQPFISFQTNRSSNACKIGDYVKNQTIIINIDLCGSGVDQTWWDSDTTCSTQASTCQSFVAGNPSAFDDAYWLFNSIRVYAQ